MSAHAMLAFMAQLHSPAPSTAIAPVAHMLAYWRAVQEAPANTRDILIHRGAGGATVFLHCVQTPADRRPRNTLSIRPDLPACADTWRHALAGLMAHTQRLPGIPPFEPSWRHRHHPAVFSTPSHRVRAAMHATAWNTDEVLLVQSRLLPPVSP